MKFPIGIQNFGEIRRNGYVYVDKTRLLYKMVSEGKYYFLSRPRRFGKSLLISMLETYFSGEKDMFEGLDVSHLEQEWQAYPILHLDLNMGKYDGKESLNYMLDDFLAKEEEKYGKTETERTSGLRFQGIIRRAFEQTGRQVVILIDEYDKPLLQAIGNEPLQTEYRNTLKAFFAAFKSCDRYIRFAFLTGVTKFGKVSVFSDLNNLEDLTMLPQYATVCGITEEELHQYFDHEVEQLAASNGMTKTECYQRLKEDFDGYHFEANTPGMYNPFSLLNTLKNQTFRDYWFETGTPSFLVYQLQKTSYPLENMTCEELFADTLNSIDILDESPLPLLYQSGYLTIKDYDPRFQVYRLGFPNREVEQGFVRYLVPYYTPNKTEKQTEFVRRFVDDLEKGNANGFMQRMESFFAGGDYQVAGKAELYFQNVLWVLFKLLGFYVDVERHTTDGRMDILVQTKDYVYIMELKIDQSADIALQQIEDKQYAASFAGDGRKVIKIGINFSSATRRMADWKINF